MSGERRQPMRGRGPMGRGMMPGEKAKDFSCLLYTSDAADE